VSGIKRVFLFFSFLFLLHLKQCLIKSSFETPALALKVAMYPWNYCAQCLYTLQGNFTTDSPNITKLRQQFVSCYLRTADRVYEANRHIFAPFRCGSSNLGMTDVNLMLKTDTVCWSSQTLPVFLTWLFANHAADRMNDIPALDWLITYVKDAMRVLRVSPDLLLCKLFRSVVFTSTPFSVLASRLRAHSHNFYPEKLSLTVVHRTWS